MSILMAERQNTSYSNKQDGDVMHSPSCVAQQGVVSHRLPMLHSEILYVNTHTHEYIHTHHLALSLSPSLSLHTHTHTLVKGSLCAPPCTLLSDRETASHPTACNNSVRGVCAGLNGVLPN